MPRPPRRARMVLACLLASAACAAPAASFFEFGVWMREIDRSSVEVQRSLTRRDAESALLHARRIEDLYGRMELFYVQDGRAADAVEVSREGRQLAAGMVPLIEQQNYSAATEAAVRIARACNDCHDVHKPLR